MWRDRNENNFLCLCGFSTNVVAVQIFWPEHHNIAHAEGGIKKDLDESSRAGQAFFREDDSLLGIGEGSYFDPWWIAWLDGFCRVRGNVTSVMEELEKRSEPFEFLDLGDFGFFFPLGSELYKLLEGQIPDV